MTDEDKESAPAGPGRIPVWVGVSPNKPEIKQVELRQTHQKYAEGMRWALFVTCWCKRISVAYFINKEVSDEYAFIAACNTCKWVHPGIAPYSPRRSSRGYSRP